MSVDGGGNVDRAQCGPLHQALARERTRVLDLQRRLDEARENMTRSQLAAVLQQDERNFGFTREELLAFVDNCEIRNDVPMPLDDQQADEFGMTAAEAEAYGRALERENGAVALTRRGIVTDLSRRMEESGVIAARSVQVSLQITVGPQ